MTASEANTQRIAKNTLMLYVRMGFCMIVSLYTSRIVLEALGVENYGVYNVVGGLVLALDIVVCSMSSSANRFITYEHGRGDSEKIRRLFGTTLFIYIILSLVIILLAETIGLWFLNNKLNIPAESVRAANVVYQLSLLSFVMAVVAAPYNAMVLANEKMGTFAWIDIISTTIRLLGILLIAYTHHSLNNLIAYAILMSGISCTSTLIYAIYCHRKFASSMSLPIADRQLIKEMSSFAGWNFIGSISSMIRSQGVNVLFNIFFGAIVNAANGIMLTVWTAINSLSNNFLAAVKPQVTKKYASDEKSYLFSLIRTSTKLSFVLLLLVSLPLMLETNYVLGLWLKEYPDICVIFIRLALIDTHIGILTTLLATLQFATGRIKLYQMVISGAEILTFPVIYLLFRAGYPPQASFVAYIVYAAVCFVLRLMFARHYVGFPVGSFLRSVCLRCVLIIGISAILPLYIYVNYPEGMSRLLLIVLSSTASIVASTYYIGCTSSERSYLRSFITSRLKTQKLVSVN